MAQQNLSAFLVLGHENIRYLTGFSGNAAYALITDSAQVLITDYRYFERAQNECQGFEVISRDRDNETLGQCIARFLGLIASLALMPLLLMSRFGSRSQQIYMRIH
eukprot:TRINITY_DN3128_c0_g1_i1.p1 TRINITY_DN3128_c0_g1~~TRINITY_DN3128_c0_g1_i1.p1  ORF type:complete len:106 (+),score=7.85 TRINITY_DN3128_c0_g1_i1:93-410(+)